MSRIKMFGAIPRRRDVSAQWFHDHYRHPHGTMGRTISTMRAYTQSHQFPSDLLDARQSHFEATAEVWFDNVADALAFPAEPQYVALLVPDEPLFVDMEALRYVFAEEEVLQSGVDGNDPRAETGDRLFRLDRRPLSVKLLQYVLADGATRWDQPGDLELGRRVGALRHVRCRPSPALHPEGAFCLGVRELYWPTRSMMEEGISADRAAWDELIGRPADAIAFLATAERFM